MTTDGRSCTWQCDRSDFCLACPPSTAAAPSRLSGGAARRDPELHRRNRAGVGGGLNSFRDHPPQTAKYNFPRSSHLALFG